LRTADNFASGEIDPVALLGQAGIGAHGAKDSGAGDLDGFGLFDDGIEDGAKARFAQGGETGSLGVAVESHAMRQGVLADDFSGAAPVEVVEVDHGAILVVADGALAGVAGEVGLGNPLAAPAENPFEVHVGDFLFARPPDCCGGGVQMGPTHANAIVTILQARLGASSLWLVDGFSLTLDYTQGCTLEKLDDWCEEVDANR